MRAVSFIENIEFDFNGTVLRNGLALGDVDNDGNVEFVIGNVDGDLCIFKGMERWQTINGLGLISCIVIGDILNIKQNCLVVVTADGWCHIFYKEKNNFEKNVDVHSLDSISSQNDPCDEDKIDGDYLQYLHKQRIPANSMVALLGDIDEDGAIELVLGLTDRVVRSYRWVTCNEVSDTKQSSNNISENAIQGKLVGLNKWECANQIGTVTLHHSADGSPCLLVAQPGGTFMRIKCQKDDCQTSVSENNASEEIDNENYAASCIDYQFLGLSRMRNPNISTEIIGDLNTKKDKTSSNDNKSQKEEDKVNKSNPYAVATLDGTIMLVQDEIILWAIQVDHETFSLSKLDVTSDGCDDIIVCSWDGQTYILDQEKNSVRFHLDEPVLAFCTGYYSVVPGEKPSPCMVYLTFWNKIYLYYNIQLKSLSIKKFNPDLTKLNGIEKILESDIKNVDKREIVEFCLYGLKSN